MEVPSQATRRDLVSTPWSHHLVGAALGIGFAMAVEAATVLGQWFRAVLQRDIALWGLWGIVGVLLLPYPDRWLPRADWGLSTIALVAGVMAGAAVWGWWSYRRHPVGA